jgi:hypothetical protein
MARKETWAKGDAVRRIFLTLLLVLAGVTGCMVTPAAAPESAPQEPAIRSDGLAPVVRGTDDLVRWPEAAAPAAQPAPPKPAAQVRVDEKARTVRIPARFTGARGMVEWLLSAGGKHPATSVLVTDCPVRDVAAALAKIGLAAGVRPQPVGEDRARLPVGRLPGDEVLIFEVVVRDAAGKETRTPAAEFLSRRADGPPLTAGDGMWVYVGPQMVREGDAEILVTEFSGSLATTNLLDSSAIIYWSPSSHGEAAPYASAFYASELPTEAGRPCEVQVGVMVICVP